MLSIRLGRKAGAKSICRSAHSRPIASVLLTAVVLGASFTGCLKAKADDVLNYPNRPIRIVVPYAAGGPSDLAARLLAEGLQSHLGQPVVIENRPGGATTIGSQSVARANPDGYTLLFNGPSNHLAPLLQKTPSYDPVEDFTPVALVARLATLLLVNKDLPASDVGTLIRYAHDNPGKLNVATAGVGSIIHLSTELFMEKTNTKMVSIPYLGAAPMLLAVSTGEANLMFLDAGSVRSFIEDGRIRALAQAGPIRSVLFPNLPTLSETIIPGFDASSWLGVVAPRGTPTAIVEKLNREINAVIAAPEFRGRAVAASMDVGGGSSVEFGETIRTFVNVWGQVIRDHHIGER